MIPADAEVLIVEDSVQRRHWFAQRVPQAYVTDNAKSAIEILAMVTIDWVFLDHDLHTTQKNTVPVADLLAAAKYAGEVIIHSENVFGQQVLARILPAAKVMAFGSFEISR